MRYRGRAVQHGLRGLRDRACLLIGCGHDSYPPEVIFAQRVKAFRLFPVFTGLICPGQYRIG
jgi:hypothetical protein